MITDIIKVKDREFKRVQLNTVRKLIKEGKVSEMILLPSHINGVVAKNQGLSCYTTIDSLEHFEQVRLNYLYQILQLDSRNRPRFYLPINVNSYEC